MSSLTGCGCRPGRLCDEHQQARRRTVLDRLAEIQDDIPECTDRTATITIITKIKLIPAVARLDTKPRKKARGQRLRPQRLAADRQRMKSPEKPT